MRHCREVFLLAAGLVMSAAPAWSQSGRGMMGGGMMGGDSASSAIMRVVHELITNHDKLRRTVTVLPNGIRTVTESDDATMAQQLKAHVAATGKLVATGTDPNLPMSTPALHGVLRNGTRIVRTAEETPRGVIVTETSDDSATVALIHQHAAEVTDLVNRGMTAMREAMMKNRGMSHDAPSASAPQPLPTRAGQEAFATIGEIVRLLDADPRTDWSKVDLEALRQHLIDMDDVTLRAMVRSEAVPGGTTFHVQGTGRVRDAIRRMALAHGATIVPADGFTWTATETAEGARVTVRARDAGDARMTARIRALGFVGILALGDHHTRHHLGIANGSMRGDHQH